MGSGSHSKSSVTSQQPKVDKASVLCEPCTSHGDSRASVSLCVQCRQFCCQTCAENHRKFKGTKLHNHAEFITEKDHRRLNTETFECDSCKLAGDIDTANAMSICRECKEMFCKNCSEVHCNTDTTKSHQILPLAAHSRKAVLGTKTLKQPKEGRLYSKIVRQAALPQKQHSNSKPPVFQNHSAFKGEKLPQPITATLRGEFSVKVPADKHSSKVYDMCTLPDGKIVVIDDRNSKMKIFTTDFKLHSSTTFAYLPGNVTCINENMIAIAMGNQVFYFKIKGNKLLQMSHKLSLKGEITGLSKTAGVLAVTYEMYRNQTRIGIINPKGTETELNKWEYSLSEGTMPRWGRVTVLKDKGKAVHVIVLEEDSGTLGCYDNQGSHIWTCLIPQTGRWHGGVATKMSGVVSLAGVILVTDVVNNAIHVVSGNGEYRGIFLDQSDGLYKPSAICFNAKDRVLYVSQFQGEKITSFSIK